jgi:hypothetical protein
VQENQGLAMAAARFSIQTMDVADNGGGSQGATVRRRSRMRIRLQLK